jgi:hypothetical protein
MSLMSSEGEEIFVQEVPGMTMRNATTHAIMDAWGKAISFDYKRHNNSSKQFG